MLHEIIYNHDKYYEVVIAEHLNVRLIQCIQDTDTKLYRIEFPEGSGNTARYTYTSAFSCYLWHAFKTAYVIIAYSPTDAKQIECSADDFKNAIRIGTEMLRDHCMSVTIYTRNADTQEYLVK